MLRLLFLTCLAALISIQSRAEGQLFKLHTHASEIDSRTKEHPEIDFVFTKNGMMERAYQFVLWLDNNNPEGNWKQFLNTDGSGLDWDKVIICGSSHGSTTSARFAKHQNVTSASLTSATWAGSRTTTRAPGNSSAFMNSAPSSMSIVPLLPTLTPAA